MIMKHRIPDRHQNADSLSKKTDFYERLEERQASQAEIKDGFSFLDKETYDELPLTRWLDKSGHSIPGHVDFPVEIAAEIKLLSRGPVGLAGSIKPGSTRTDQAGHQEHSPTEQDGERGTGCHVETP